MPRPRKGDKPSRRSADFGFRRVGEGEKAPLVRAVFASVAQRYDLMNDLMSLGVHRLWKHAFMAWLNPRPGTTLLDVGGGTGDIAHAFLARGGGRAVVCDASHAMLTVGRDQAIDRGILERLAWIGGDAENLPVATASVDTYAAAFCLRNVTRMDAALAEARRVLRPGGRFLCLEFSRLAVPALERLYDAYSFTVLPALGRAVADDAAAYRYLAESIRRFPAQERFAAMITAADLDGVRWRNLSGGIAAMHSAWRL